MKPLGNAGDHVSAKLSEHYVLTKCKHQYATPGYDIYVFISNKNMTEELLLTD